MTRDATPRPVSRAALAGYFLRLGLVGFGGPAALADHMRRDLVERRRWISPAEFDLGLTVAAACPGPLAYQLGVYCGFVRHGIAGAFAIGLAFATAPFLLVVAVAAAYDLWSGNVFARAVFAGAAPVIVVVVARACWSLARKTMDAAWVGWGIAAAGAGLTWALGREPFLLFVVAAAIGAWRLRPQGAPPSRPDGAGAIGSPPASTSASAPAWLAPFGLPASGVVPDLFVYFFKTGCLVFGSGLVIVPVLRAGVVEAYGWLDEQAFLDSVTVGLVTPGPVVITATFVGYAVGALPGAVAATAGMFLPAILFTIVATPWFVRHQRHPVVAGAVRGIIAAVVGVLAGTVPMLAAGAVSGLWPAAILAGAALVALTRRVPDPVLVGLGAAAGLASALIGE